VKKSQNGIWMVCLSLTQSRGIMLAHPSKPAPFRPKSDAPVAPGQLIEPCSLILGFDIWHGSENVGAPACHGGQMVPWRKMAVNIRVLPSALFAVDSALHTASQRCSSSTLPDLRSAGCRVCSCIGKPGAASTVTDAYDALKGHGNPTVVM
jgi:hypothetical protein